MSAGAGADSVPTLAQAVERLDRVVELMERVLEAAPKAAAGTVQQVTVPQPVTQPQRAERMVWVMCGVTAVMAMVAGGAVVAAVLQGQRLSDMRADHQRQIDRIERKHEQLAEWARAESNITRGYIWTGKVPVANPYPSQAEAKP